MTGHRIFTTSFASVTPHYLAKAERKGRSRAEVDAVIAWLSFYDEAGLAAQLTARVDFATFFAEAPALNRSPERVEGPSGWR